MSQNAQPLPNGRIPLLRSPHSISLAIGCSLVLATVLRLYGISTESLWLDEATSLMLARMDAPTLVRWTALDIHPPLYYVLLHYWIALGESEIAVRGLSALVGVLNVWAIYALGRTLFDRRAAWLAACLLAVAPFHIWYSQEARMYTCITLFITVSVWLAFGVWGTRRWTTWVAFVLVTVAALYTHYYAVFGILLENLFFSYLLVRRRLVRDLIWRWLAAQAAIFVLFLPWFPTFLLPITVGGGGWIALGMGRPSFGVLAQTMVLYMVGPARASYPSIVRRLGYGLFLLLTLQGIWSRSSSRWAEERHEPPYSERECTAFCLAYLMLPLGIAWVVSQVFKPMYSARYMLPFLIPFLLLAARGIAHIHAPIRRASVLVALVACMGVGVVAQVATLEKPDWRGLGIDLIARSEENDLVLFMPGWHAKSFAYYAGDALALYSDVPIPLERYGDEALDKVAAAVSGYTRVWFVWEEGHYTDPQGEVYAYLEAHYYKVEDLPFALVGRVILFESPEPVGAS